MISIQPQRTQREKIKMYYVRENAEQDTGADLIVDFS
jgi:hypothetical protein